MQDLVRVYVGTDRSQLLAVAVLEHSIRRHARRPVLPKPFRLDQLKTALDSATDG